MGNIKRLFETYPGTLVTGVLACALAVAFIGCQPKIDSPISGERVTPTQFANEVADTKADLQAEQAILAAKVQKLAAAEASGLAEIERQQALIGDILDAVGEVVVGAAGQYAGLATLGLGLLAAGLGVDAARKDGVIRGQKQAIKAGGAS